MELVDSLQNLYYKIDEALDCDEVELAGDLVKILGKLHKGINYLKKKNFIKFLEGLSFDSITEAELNRLSRFIDSKTTSEYLLQLILELLSSKSNKSCFISGIYVSQFLSKDKEVDFEAMNILGFLSETSDFDIDNLKYLILHSKNDKDVSESFYSEFRTDELKIDEFQSLIDKCIKYSIFGKIYTSEDNIDVESYPVTHPLESGFRTSSSIDIEESYYKKSLFSTISDLISISNV